MFWGIEPWGLHVLDLESYVEIIKFSRKAAATNPLKDILGVSSPA